MIWLVKVVTDPWIWKEQLPGNVRLDVTNLYERSRKWLPFDTDDRRGRTCNGEEQMGKMASARPKCIRFPPLPPPLQVVF